jgi:hypothetical protein
MGVREFLTYAEILFLHFIGLKRTPVVITELLWKPFDVRFRDVMERMKFHQKVVKAELEVAAYGKLDVSMGAELKLLEIIQKESTRSHAMLEEVRMSQQEASQGVLYGLLMFQPDLLLTQIKHSSVLRSLSG